jgi:hypothetical protein
MLEAWTRHLKTEEEKTRFKNIYSGSKQVLERLSELLDQIENDDDELETNPKVYDIPNWPYRQADLNGHRRAIKQIKKLIKT